MANDNNKLIVEPKIKQLYGSNFPQLPQYSSGYIVETLDGTIYYHGTSEPVARLITACITPRVY